MAVGAEQRRAVGSLVVGRQVGGLVGAKLGQKNVHVGFYFIVAAVGHKGKMRFIGVHVIAAGTGAGARQLLAQWFGQRLDFTAFNRHPVQVVLAVFVQPVVPERVGQGRPAVGRNLAVPVLFQLLGDRKSVV